MTMSDGFPSDTTPPFGCGLPVASCGHVLTENEGGCAQCSAREVAGSATDPAVCDHWSANPGKSCGICAHNIDAIGRLRRKLLDAEAKQ